MKILKMSILSGFILTACATTDAPTPPPPALFQGSGGVKFVQGQVVTKPDGKFTAGEVFSEGVVEHTRTGTLLNDVSYYEPSIMGLIIEGKDKISAGTKVYAISISNYSKLAWCAPGKSKLFQMNYDDLATCILWDSPDNVQFMQGSTSQSVYYSPVVYGRAAPMVGDYPEIREEPVDFGRNFKMQAIYKDTDKNDFDITINFWDGKKSYKIRKIEVPKNADGIGELELWGGVFKFTQVDVTDRKSVSIEVLKAPTGKMQN